MPHKCDEPNCTSDVFGGGKCRYHQFRRSMQGGDKHKKKQTKAKTINKESPKRKKEHKYYTQLCQELWDELVAKKQNVCLFCGEKMDHKENFHHIKGRIEENYTNREFLFPCHNQCHVWDYHQASIEQLMNQKWYNGFLNRLKGIDIQSYYKELKKQDKRELNLEID